MRYFILLGLLTVITPLLSAKDAIWTNWNSPAGAQSIISYYQNHYETKGDYDSCWKYAEALNFYAKMYVKKEDRKPYYEKAVKACEKAVKLKPNGPEGYLWYATVFGRLTEMNKDPFGVPKIIELTTKLIEIDPSFGGGAGYLIRARLYHKAPGWPISVGDHDKALADYQAAMKYGKKNKGVYLFYAEFLVEKGKKDEALKVIEKGLAIKPDPDEPRDDTADQKMKALKEKCK
jgi:tetratricopeptide (TPR) repeat protein